MNTMADFSSERTLEEMKSSRSHGLTITVNERRHIFYMPMDRKWIDRRASCSLHERAFIGEKEVRGL
jgi:hypothetical protein